MNSWYFPNHVEYENDTDELKKLQEEVEEFEAACTGVDKTRLDLISEGLDVIHVVENILYHHGVTYDELDKGVEYVKIKNELRGYYPTDKRTRAQKNGIQASQHGRI